MLDMLVKKHLQQFLIENNNNKDLEFYTYGLAKSFGRLQQATAIIAQKGINNPNEVAATASEYLNLFGYVAIAFMWSKTAKICLSKLKNDKSGFYSAKLKTATFYFEKILPETGSLFSIIMTGGNSIMNFSEDDFENYNKV